MGIRSFRRGAPAALTIAAALISAILWAQTPSALPAQLDDREFWRLFTEFSEAGGSFQDENYVSNEQGYQRAIPRLLDTVTRGGVYLGVGPEQNFTYISALQPAMAFIIDIRRQNAMELLLYKALFELAPDRADFVSRLFSLPKPANLSARSSVEELFDAFAKVRSERRLFEENLAEIFDVLTRRHAFALSADDRVSLQKVYTAFFENGLNIQYIYQGNAENHATYPRLMTLTDAAGKNWSYLATEDNFRGIKEMQRRNLIVPIVGDFAGPRAVRAVGQYVRDNRAVISVFYTSNVEPYLFAAKSQQAFYESVATLPLNSSSMFIRTFFASTMRECAAQRPVLMTSTLSNIMDLVRDYKRGDIKTQCDLVTRSR